MLSRSHILSFLRALGSLFDLSPRPASKPVRMPESYSVDLSFMKRSDADAIRSDWEAIGRDMYAAIGQFERSYGIERAKPSKKS
jgi:hypothetical protein